MSLISRHTSSFKKGFTLLEVLIVLLVVGLMTGVVLFNLGGSASTQVRTNAQLIAQGFMVTREVAKRTGKTQVATLDLTAFTIDVPSSQERGKREQFDLSDELTYTLHTVTNEVLNETRANFRFFPDGSSSGGHVLVAIDNIHLFVNIDWLTGNVTVEEGDER